MENNNWLQQELEEDRARQARVLAARGVRIVAEPTGKTEHISLGNLAVMTGVELADFRRVPYRNHDYVPPIAMQHVTSIRYEDHSQCPGHCAAVVVTDALVDVSTGLNVEGEDECAPADTDTETRVEVIWCCDTPEVHRSTATPLEIAVIQFARTCLDNPNSSTWASFTCGEIDALAAVLRIGGHEDAAAHVIDVHAQDDDEGDDHYVGTETDGLVSQLQDAVAGKVATPDAGGLTHWWVLAESNYTDARSIHPVTITEGYTIIEDAPTIIKIVRPELIALAAIAQSDHSKTWTF